jgi:hypothetical protein
MAEESGPSVRLLRWCGMATGVATDSATSEDDEVSVIRLKSRAAAPVPNPANWVTTEEDAAHRADPGPLWRATRHENPPGYK